MIKKRTSTHYFQQDCQAVWDAVTTSKGGAGGFSYSPLSDEEFAEARRKALEKGTVLARVTDMTPGKSCAYELYAPKFDVHWSASFSEVDGGECRMVMTEVYEFHPGAVGQYILALLFLHQRTQHKDFFAEIERRLKVTA